MEWIGSGRKEISSPSINYWGFLVRKKEVTP